MPSFLKPVLTLHTNSLDLFYKCSFSSVFVHWKLRYLSLPLFLSFRLFLVSLCLKSFHIFSLSLKAMLLMLSLSSLVKSNVCICVSFPCCFYILLLTIFVLSFFSPFFSYCASGLSRLSMATRLLISATDILIGIDQILLKNKPVQMTQIQNVETGNKFPGIQSSFQTKEKYFRCKIPT